MHFGHKPAERSAPEALGPGGRKSGAESSRHIADPMIPKLYLASTEESSCWRRALSKLTEEVRYGYEKWQWRQRTQRSHWAVRQAAVREDAPQHHSDRAQACAQAATAETR